MEMIKYDIVLEQTYAFRLWTFAIQALEKKRKILAKFYQYVVSKSWIGHSRDIVIFSSKRKPKSLLTVSFSMRDERDTLISQHTQGTFHIVHLTLTYGGPCNYQSSPFL